MDPASYQNLIQHYRERSDEEILRLSNSVDDLTEDAKSALAEEMSRRDLGEADLAPYRAEALEQKAKVQATVALRERAFKRAKKFALFVLGTWAFAILATYLLRRSGISGDISHSIAIIANILTAGLGLSLSWVLRARFRLWRSQDHLDQFR